MTAPLKHTQNQLVMLYAMLAMYYKHFKLFGQLVILVIGVGHFKIS